MKAAFHFLIFNILVTFFSSMAHAQISEWQYSPLASRAPFQKAADSIWKLKSTMVSSACSGVFISNQGHFLTNLHCITHCLKTNDLFQNSDPTNSYEKIEPVTSSDFHELFLTTRKIKPISCKDLIITHPDNSNMFGNPQLLFWGSGWGTISSKDIGLVEPSDFEAFKTSIEDFALLKFKTSEDESFPCLPSVKEPLEADASVFAFGYPDIPTREGRMELFSSEGSLHDRRALSPYIHSLELSDSALQRHRELDSLSSVILSSAGIQSGMSGGPILDEQGNLVGLNYSTNKSAFSQLDPLPGSSFHVEINHMLDRVFREKEFAGDQGTLETDASLLQFLTPATCEGTHL